MNLTKKDTGSILVIVVFILLILTVIGIFATNTSTLEIMISGNDLASKTNFYRAESTAYVGMSEIDAFTTKPNPANYSWLHPKNSPADPRDSNTWTDANSQKVSSLGDSRYVVNDEGKYIPKGSSLVIKPAYGSGQINVYRISGRSAQKNGESIVIIGFKKKY